MELVEVHDQQRWDAYVSAQARGSFLQSWMWGAFQEQQGHEVKRFFVMDETIVLACQLIRYNRRFGSCYWFAPRGPITPDLLHAHEALKFFLSELTKKGALSGRIVFLRLEPSIQEQERIALPPSLVATHSMSPASTIRIDLSQDEETLLAKMHPKTRYNIRVAERHGVVVRGESSVTDLDAFIALTKETASRDQIIVHDEAYLRATHQYLSGCRMSRLRLAEHAGNVLAVNMEMAYGDTVTYLHGASSSTSRQVMAPTLLQWEAIKAAKAEGYRWYDLYGANPSSTHSRYYKKSWEGITRFKQGLGGEQVDYVGTWDLPMKKLFYHAVMKVRG